MGTPQGGCLSTLNYLVYINDIGYLPIRGLIRAFADDKAIAYDEYNPTTVQDDMKMITEYFRINKLTINLNKTKLLVFNSPDPTTIIPLTIHQTTIERLNTVKYLGLQLDHKLTFDEHINELARYVSSVIGIMYKVRSFLPRHIMHSIYNSLIHSKLMYMISIYGNGKKTAIDRLFVLQKRALKIIYNLPQEFSTKRLFTEKAKNCLPIRSLHVQSTATLVHQILRDETITNIRFNRVPVNQRTRAASRGDLIPRKAKKSTFGDACFEKVGPAVYNSLPQSVVETSSLPMFKRKLKDLLLNDVARTLS